MIKNKWLAFFWFILLPQVAGFLGSLVTTPAIPTWYDYLNKPLLTPPNFVFAPVWTALFILMGISAFLIWKTGIEKNINISFERSIFYIQLILNTGWSLIFFGLKNPGFALIEIIILWIFILIMMIRFFKISKLAGSFILPYLLWVGFATYLTYGIWVLN